MSSSPPSSERFSPDDALPPVEPPSAGCILQLFIVPGVIVVVVVMIWLMFNWLAHKGNDRDAFVRDLQRNNEARWQAAVNLANALNAERGSKEPKLAGDHELAKQLAGILDKEIDAGSLDERPITLRIYLSRALGQFQVDDGLPTLIKAAGTQREDVESDVRRAAIEGIALLADNLPPGDTAFAENEKLTEVLFAAAKDTDPRTRSTAAVALGVIGGQMYLDRLRGMLDDSNPDVRYNAALRLAQHGDAAAVPVLDEMLDPSEQAGVETEKQEDMRPRKRVVISGNALRAVQQLVAKNPAADLGPLPATIEKLRDSTGATDVRLEATTTLRQLQDRGAGASK